MADLLNVNIEQPTILRSAPELISTISLSEEVKQALLECFEHVAWVDDQGQTYYDALYDALYPPVDLSSISCVYTQSGTVYDTDSLDDLKPDLVVTAHYTDQSTQTITTYTLSGTLTEGTSTITVSYGGKTTTFDVTVTAVPSFYPLTLTENSEGVGFGALDVSKNTLTPPYISTTTKNRIHAIGDNTGYPVTYGKSYRITISGTLGTEILAPRTFTSAGKTQIENVEAISSSNTTDVSLNVSNQTFTFTPALINSAEPVCMWLNFKKNSSSGQWGALSDMLPITIEEISGE